MLDSNIIISKNKQSLEYIPSPCLKSHKLKIMRKIMGRSAELMYTDLIKFIGSQKHTGYWIQWNKDAQNCFMLEYDYSKEELKEYLAYYFEEDLFSKAVFDTFNVITGEEIQQYWLMCAKKRMRFVEGIIEPYMVVSFENEVEENKKRFSRFNKLVEIKSEFDEEFQGETLSHSTSTPQEYLHESLTSAHIQHKHKAVSKSVAISSSNKQNIIHPTDVDKTCKEFSSTDSILNSFKSEKLVNGFESEKNISNDSNKKISPAKSKIADSGQDEKVKPKKVPHPAREGIIAIWERGNNMAYVQDKDNNMAIPSLIRKLEALIQKQVNGDNHDDFNTVSATEISQKYEWLWANKFLLSDFLQKQYRTFFGIEKYFHDIVGDIRDSGKKAIQKQAEAQSVRQPAYMRLVSEMP
jgi:hypothetical protein